MIYLDYCATTPVDKRVLESFNKACLDYVGNPNSMHQLGVNNKKLIEQSTKQIADLLKVKENEIIYTSGSSESNNLAIKGIAYKYQNRGKHIITTVLEHSSVVSPFAFLEQNGFEIDFVPLLEDGTVDLVALKELIREDTILVSICAVNSEVGIIQPIEQIAMIVKEHPKCFFHVDMTQSIGKIYIPLENIDLVSFSGHKIFGLKGVGALIKKEKIILEPLIHGGKSTTHFRSGTPATPLIVSLAKALRLSLENLDEKYNYILKLNQELKEALKKYDGVYINSNDKCLPHVLNISIPSIKPETFQHALEQYEIYISTQTACSTKGNPSKAVYAVTKDNQKAISSLRISLSYLTTEEEISKFLEAFDKCYQELSLKK